MGTERRRGDWGPEALAAAICLSLSLVAFKNLLFTASATLSHDSLQWAYPVFAFFSESLWRGEYPLWNPFSHAGDPFFPLLFQQRTLDPLATLLVLILKPLQGSTVLAFNWHRYLLSLLTSVGIYFCLRPIASRLWIRIAVMPLLLLSPVFWGHFHQDGILSQFLWVPYLMLVLRDVAKQKELRWPHVWAIAALLGWSFQSYFFSGVSLYLLFLAASAYLFYRRDLKRILGSPTIKEKALLLAVLLCGMAIPNLALWRLSDSLVFPLRTYRPQQGLLGLKKEPPISRENPLLARGRSLQLSYPDVARNGEPLRGWDLLLLPAGSGSWAFFTGSEAWGKGSDVFLYLGALGWLIVWLGIMAGEHRRKKLWLLATGGTLLVMLGAQTPLHPILYYLFPPLWFVRHTHCFALYLEFGLLYFFVLGLNAIASTRPLFSEGFSDRGLTAALTALVTALVCCLPLFKPPVGWLLTPSVAIVAFAATRAYPRIGKLGLWIALAGGHGLGLLVTAAINAPQELLFILLRWAIFAVPPVLAWLWAPKKRAQAAFVVCLSADLFFCTVRIQAAFPEARNTLAVSSPPMIGAPREISPTRDPGCLDDRGFCVRYAALLDQKPYLFPPVYYGPLMGKTTEDKIGNARSRRMHNSFLLYRSYAELVLLESPKTIAELFAVGRSPFECRRLQGTRVSDVLASPRVPCEIDVESTGLNHVTLRVRPTEAGSFLFWSDGYDPDWHAYLDGQEVVVERLAKHFKGVLLHGTSPAVVQLVYRPILFCLGLAIFYAISLAGILAAIRLVVLARRTS